MELFIFARFHACEGQADAVAAALHEVIGPSSEEPGCLAIQAHRSIHDPRLFYVHSRWFDEAACRGRSKHATLNDGGSRGASSVRKRSKKITTENTENHGIARRSKNFGRFARCLIGAARSAKNSFSVALRELPCPPC